VQLQIAACALELELGAGFMLPPPQATTASATAEISQRKMRASDDTPHQMAATLSRVRRLWKTLQSW
jgi:hypothetical protein